MDFAWHGFLEQAQSRSRRQLEEGLLFIFAVALPICQRRSQDQKETFVLAHPPFANDL